MPEAAPEVEVGIQIGKWVFGKVVPGKEEGPKKEPTPLPNGLKELPPYTDITILLDRSGSMCIIRQATVDGINNFMRSVDELPGEGCWTLILFDDHNSAKGAGEDFPKYVFKGADTRNRPLLETSSYIPRGSTALVDAFYTVLTHKKAEISSLAKEERARRKLLIVVMTDGEENSSIEYSSAQLRQLVGECQAAGWEFLYLGANQDSFTQASKFGATGQFCSPFFGGVQANWAATPTGVAELCSTSNSSSAAAGCRNWKLDGNESAQSLMQNPGKT